jgi:pimeloyl-ACP methyl ester carboxylesterase
VWGRSSDRAVIRFVDADGVRLRTSVCGSGSPLLLITGLGASLDLAEPFERELVKRGHQVVSFDAPGVGQSTPYALPRRMRGVARTVAKMAAALGYDRMDVLGVSLGGVVTQQLGRFTAPVGPADRDVAAALTSCERPAALPATCPASNDSRPAAPADPPARAAGAPPPTTTQSPPGR